jgi:hypothetical protein
MKVRSAVRCLVLTIGCAFVFHPRPVCAQLPTPNPLIVPPTPGPGPAPLRPIAPLPGIPSLVAVPSPAANATPVSASRIFDCSCFGLVGPTHWMGRVTAPSYFAARQSAISACLAYNENKQPQPPVVAAGPSSSTGQGASTSVGSANQSVTGSGLIANQAAVASALSAGQQLPSSVTFFAPQQLRACSRCACD